MLINLITKGDRLLINTCTEHGQGQRRLDSNFREPTWLLICFHGRTCLPSRGCAHTNDTDVADRLRPTSLHSKNDWILTA